VRSLGLRGPFWEDGSPHDGDVVRTGIPGASLIAGTPFVQNLFQGIEDGRYWEKGHYEHGHWINGYYDEWCAVFVNWCLKEAGVARRNSSGARYWLNWGRSIDRKDPLYGCITILASGSGKHVGFFVGHDRGSYVLILGGNQRATEGSAKLHSVNIRAFNEAAVIQYRWPPGMPVPKNISQNSGTQATAPRYDRRFWVSS
jgi:uncharacterized protein (TIGR02594 family)